jgi:hypothetical protein
LIRLSLIRLCAAYLWKHLLTLIGKLVALKQVLELVVVVLALDTKDRISSFCLRLLYLL